MLEDYIGSEELDKKPKFNVEAALVDAYSFVDTAYSQLAATIPHFKSRAEQIELSKDIARSFIIGMPYAAEAPTGTGKTVAYLVGALAAKKATGRSIVVATATVNLQEQILENDLPKLFERAGLILNTEYAVAKGKGRYFCPNNANRFVERTGTDTQAELDFDGTAEEVDMTDQINAQKITELMADWEKGTWDGDIDSYSQGKPRCWNIVSANSETCIRKKCDYYEVCPFFRAREGLADKQVIVTNQDMVLADLMLLREDKETLFGLKEYALVVDEAHQLPDKATEKAVAEINVGRMGFWLKKIPDELGANLFKQSSLVKALEKKGLTEHDFDVLPLLRRIEAIKMYLDNDFAYDAGYNCIFEDGILPEKLVIHCRALLDQCSVLRDCLDTTVKILLRNSDESKKQSLMEIHLFNEATICLNNLTSLIENITRFLENSHHPRAKWVHYRTYEDPDRLPSVLICSSPLDGAEYMEKALWSNPDVSAVFLSATLKGMGNFEPFLSGIGAQTKIAPYHLKGFNYVLPYHNSSIQVAEIDSTPDDSNFVNDLMKVLPQYLNKHEGTLFLFNSRVMARQVASQIKAIYGNDFVISQDERASLRELLAEHKRKIDKGEGSIIIGLGKMAEGVDLPGAYCTHVMVARLPFENPTEPVELERQKEVQRRKGDYFQEVVVPRATVKLVQIVGRLVRSEQDVGRVTIFDKRLGSTKYGKKMKSSLPPFKSIAPDALEGVLCKCGTQVSSSLEMSGKVPVRFIYCSKCGYKLDRLTATGEALSKEELQEAFHNLGKFIDETKPKYQRMFIMTSDKPYTYVPRTIRAVCPCPNHADADSLAKIRDHYHFYHCDTCKLKFPKKISGRYFEPSEIKTIFEEINVSLTGQSNIYHGFTGKDGKEFSGYFKVKGRDLVLVAEHLT